MELNKIKESLHQEKNYTNILTFPADLSGCQFYRLLAPALCVRSFTDKIIRHETMRFIADGRYFENMNIVQCQRFVSDSQTKYLNNFLKPLSDNYGFWLIYEIDDVIHKDDIPPYNRGRKAYLDDGLMDNISKNLNAVDLITTTTYELKNYLIRKFNVENPNKIIVIPNYLPRWWVGETYDSNRIRWRYKNNQRKRKIVLPLSLSHYDVEGINNGIDDVTHICDFIRSTCDKYEWTFLGGAYPKQLEDLVKDKKVIYKLGSDIFNYPRELFSLGYYDVIVAPLQDNIFNRCKSNIKLIEGWGIGIPVIAQNISTYNKYTDMVFKDGNDLQNQLDNLFATQKHYLEVVEYHRNVVDYGDNSAKHGWWMEKNLYKWMELFTLPKKSIKIDYQFIKANLQNKPTIIK